MAFENVTKLVPTPAAAIRPALRGKGSTGLQNVGSIIREQFIPELNGQEAMRTFKRMGDYDPVCGSILYAIDKLLRGVKWRMEPASQRPADREAADFVHTCLHDMSTTLTDTISEIATFLQYGFSLHYKVFKRRLGPDQDDNSFRSKYRDGRIGWQGLPIRSQDTIWRWNFSDCGDLMSAEQLAPPTYQNTILPMRECLLFRTSTHKGNPEGRSIFLPAYESWYAKRNIQAIEAVGIERDLAGLPVAFVPADYLLDVASQAKKDTVARLETICANIRQDESASIIMPLLYDQAGHSMFDLKLLTSGGARQFDTDKIVQRYDHRIAMCALADFVLMGQSSSSTGSLAMHADKTDLFGSAIAAFLDVIASTLQPAIDELIRLNDFVVSDSPRLVHDDIGQIDLATMGEFVSKLSTAGMPLFPNRDLEARLLEMARLPKPVEYESEGSALLDQDGENDQPEPIIPGAAPSDGVTVAQPADIADAPTAAVPDPASGANVTAGTSIDPSAPINQKTLAGGQIAQVAAIVTQVAQGVLPRDSAVAILTLAFPIDESEAERVLGSAGKGTAPQSPPAPVTVKST